MSRLRGDRVVVVPQARDQFLPVTLRGRDESFRIVAGRRAATVAIDIQPNRAAASDGASLPIGRRRLVRFRRPPMESVDAGSGGDGDQMDIVLKLWCHPVFDTLHSDWQARVGRLGNRDRTDRTAVGEQLDLAGARPMRSEDSHRDHHLVVASRHHLARVVLVVHGDLGEQTVAHHHPALHEIVDDRVDVNVPRVTIIAANVRPPLPDEMPADIVRVAASDRRHVQPAIEQPHPVVEQPQRVRLRGPRVHDLHRVESQRPTVEVLARDGVEMLRPKRTDAAVQVAGMIQNGDLHVRRPIDVVEQQLPVGLLVIDRQRFGCNRKDVEVSASRRDFVSHHRSEVPPHAQLRGDVLVVDVLVVIGGNRQLDPFSCERDHPLFDRRVAVSRMSQRVNVSVTGDIAFRWNFAPNGDGLRQRLSRRDSHLSPSERVLEAAPGEDRVPTRRDTQRRAAGRSERHPRPNGQALVGLGPERLHRPPLVQQRDATRQRMLCVPIEHNHVERRFSECLPYRAIDDFNLAHAHVIRRGRASGGRFDHQRVRSLQQATRRNSERHNHVVLVDGQCAKFLAVERDVPNLLHVLLAHEQRLFRLVLLRYECHIEPLAVRGLWKLGPLPLDATSQVKQLRFDRHTFRGRLVCPQGRNDQQHQTTNTQYSHDNLQ